MAIFLSVVWLLSWVVVGVCSFLGGKTNNLRWLFVAMAAIVVMFVSIYFLGRY